jgi:hypothetical protein
VGGLWTVFATTQGNGDDFPTSARMFQDSEERTLPPYFPCTYRAAYPEPDTPEPSSGYPSSNVPSGEFIDDFLTVRYSGLYWRPVSGAWHLEPLDPAPAALVGQPGEAWLFECSTAQPSSSLTPGWCPPPDIPYVKSSSSIIPSTFVSASSDVGGIPPSDVVVELGGLWTSYFATPAQAYPPVYVHTTPGINFALSSGQRLAPEYCGRLPMPTVGYSARWVGYLVPEFSETYTLYLNVKGIATLHLAGVALINSGTFFDGELQADVALRAGQAYYLVINFDSAAASSRLSLSWSSVSRAKEVVPAERLGHTATPQYEERLVSVSTGYDSRARNIYSFGWRFSTFGAVNNKNFELIGSVRGPWREAGDVTYTGKVDTECTLRNTTPSCSPADGYGAFATTGWGSATVTLVYNRAIGWWILSAGADGYSGTTTQVPISNMFALGVAYGPGSPHEIPKSLPFGNFTANVRPSTGNTEVSPVSSVTWTAANCPPCLKATRIVGLEVIAVAFPHWLTGRDASKRWEGAGLTVGTRVWAWEVVVNGESFRVPRRTLAPPSLRVGEYLVEAGGGGDSGFPGTGLAECTYDAQYSGCPPQNFDAATVVLQPTILTPGAAPIPYYGRTAICAQCDGSAGSTVEVYVELEVEIAWNGTRWVVFNRWDGTTVTTWPNGDQTVSGFAGWIDKCNNGPGNPPIDGCAQCIPPGVEYFCGYDVIMQRMTQPSGYGVCPQGFPGILTHNTFVLAGIHAGREYFVMDGPVRLYLWNTGPLFGVDSKWQVGRILNGLVIAERTALNPIGDYSPGGTVRLGVCPSVGTENTELCPSTVAYAGRTPSLKPVPHFTFLRAEGYINGSRYYMSMDPSPWYLYRTTYGLWVLSPLLNNDTVVIFIKVSVTLTDPLYDTDSPVGAYAEPETGYIGPTLSIGWCPARLDYSYSHALHRPKRFLPGELTSR